MKAETAKHPSRLRLAWRAAWRPSRSWSIAALVLVGFLAGGFSWSSFSLFMEFTNQPEFCLSCHEMAQTVGAEWKKSVHYSNPSGVRVTCSDCHVPKDWTGTAKLVRKIQATNELWHYFRGTIDTPEKFEAKRAELAEHVWRTMKANDSRECRNCHSYDAMAFHKQSQRAREKMEEASQKGETCIECHKGIAHKLPKRDD
jgi:nitrate/TMAO reductase-like tetraheme cytochrome c subunit